MDYTAIKYEFDDGIAVVTLNRPEARSALGIPMRRELAGAAAQFADRRRR